MKTKSDATVLGTSAGEWKKEDLELAHKIHVLAQLVHGQLVATHYWAAGMARSVPPGPTCPTSLPGAFAGAWTIPAAWPCCP